MALVAALATALVALGTAVAVGGYKMGSVTIPPALYALALLPGLAAVGAGRRPSAVPKPTVPPSAVRVLKVALIGAGLLFVSAKRLPEGAGEAVTTAAGLAVAGLSFWWPLPSVLRLCVALATLVLLRPGANPLDHVPAMLLTGAFAAVSLVACNRLAASGRPVLGGVHRPARRRRVAADVAVVALAILLAALVTLSLQITADRPAQARTGSSPEQQQSTLLGYQEVLDPAQAGPGGRGSDPDEVLLRVHADRPGVLRAVTFDRWDGRRWERARGTQGTSLRGFVPMFLARLEVPFPDDISEQRIRIAAAYAGVAVGTPVVYSYDLPVGAEVGLDGTVRLVPPLGRGAEYTSQTGRLHTTPDELRAAGTGVSFGARPADPAGGMGDQFTADPALSERARALVGRVTAGASTGYDKVAALSHYLSTNVTVDDEVNALAPGGDPVDSVLFGARTASPERLASTLALMIRAVGIPSRLATGFLPGQRPVLGGNFVVRARHAHAWVEVPFIGAGWQRFDPTGRIAAAEKEDSLWSRLWRAGQRYWPLLVLMVLVLLLFVIRQLVLRRRRLAAIPWATRYFARLLRVGAKRGRPRWPSETPGEYATALAEGVLADERLVEVGRVVTAAAWSGREPRETTRRWAEQVLDEASSATRRVRRFHVRSRTGA